MRKLVLAADFTIKLRNVFLW